MLFSKIQIIGGANQAAYWTARSLNGATTLLGATALGATMTAAAPYVSVIGTGVSVVCGTAKVVRFLFGRKKNRTGAESQTLIQ